MGIDPGSNGGIAIFIPGMKTKAIKMPKDNSDLAAIFEYYVESQRWSFGIWQLCSSSQRRVLGTYFYRQLRYKKTRGILLFPN